MLLLFVWCTRYTNQSTHHSPTTPDKNKKPGEGQGLSPDKVGGMYYCTFFTVTIMLVCLASIGGFWENDTYTQRRYICPSHCQIVPNDLYGRFFSSFIFSFATSPVRNHCNNARSYIHYQEKRVPKRTNKPIKNAVATATLGGHGQVSDRFII